MKRWVIHGAALGMLLLILDSRCAARSAQEALELCLKSVIPGLFPMFVLSGMLVSGIGRGNGVLLSSMERLIGLPSGGGGLFLLGILGGFPVGAQCIGQAVEAGALSRPNAERMLGFCNNCSPAFLFGIAGSIFTTWTTALMLFLIQLETAVLVAAFTDFHPDSVGTVPSRECSITESVARAVRSMGNVCGWVVLAGVITGFLKRWIYPLFPDILGLLASGLLEVTGGVLGLSVLPWESLRFLLSVLFVCFGGFCVWMQIGSAVAAQGLSTVFCFRQKTLQSLLGLVLGAVVLFIGPAGLLVGGIPLLIRKKTLEKPIATMYNSPHKGGYDHAVS